MDESVQNCACTLDKYDAIYTLVTYIVFTTVSSKTNFWHRANTIVLLRSFCKVYELGGFSMAASILTISQSSISRQVQALEKGLGTKLFSKSPSGKISPTKDGKLFYNLIKPKVQSIDCVYDYFKKKKLEAQNKLITISSHHTVITYMLPNCIKKYRENYNDQETEFVIESSPDLNSSLSRLDDGEVDFVIYPMNQALSRKYTVTDLITCDPIILMHKDNILAKKQQNKITFFDLAEQNFLFIDQIKIMPMFVQICEEYGITGNIKFINSDWETVRNFVRLDLGVHIYNDVNDRSMELTDPKLISKNVSHLFPQIVTRVAIRSGAIFNKNKTSFLQVLEDIAHKA
ncbi:MAG: LysR family transcriptional regulator [Rickettsiales bacterium]|jgi:DNA-binding transcriptional LysR family regulator|nr:LysR family transcriptional regulator [Rickettsiales bacterium]